MVLACLMLLRQTETSPMPFSRISTTICSPSVTTSCTFRKYNHLTWSAIPNIHPVTLPTKHSTSSPRSTVIVISPPTCRSSTLPPTNSSTSVINTGTLLPAWAFALWPWVSSTTSPVTQTSHGSSKRTKPLPHLGSRPQSTTRSQLIFSSCSAITLRVQLSLQAPLELTTTPSVKLVLMSPSRSLEVCILTSNQKTMLTFLQVTPTSVTLLSTTTWPLDSSLDATVKLLVGSQ